MKCVQINIQGIVQGVGFRPFIYRLATHYHLKGYVLNNSEGVKIEVEGDDAVLEQFIVNIPKQKPPLAQILSIIQTNLPIQNYQTFSILSSSEQNKRNTLIPSDIAVCSECVEELFTPGNRRYRYPFINCTNCGPRYTIIQDIPYDRPKTAMSVFALCEDCEAEYHDPANRRFHAQPNACWKCGPRLTLCDAHRRQIETVDPIADAISLLKNGKILAVKGLGGFHLAVDATNEAAVQTLRQKKRRSEKPFAVMFYDIASLEKYVFLDEEEAKLLGSPFAPIVLLPKRRSSSFPSSEIAPSVAPQNLYLGVMLPYTPIQHLLIRDNFLALVMTSANMSEEPIVKDNMEALEKLSCIADAFLMHNRDIYLRCDDSIQKVVLKSPTVIRRARGYVPQPILLKEDLPCVLGCGAELKNTFCLIRGRQAFLSQHIGDMENLETLDFFENTIRHLTKILEVKPVAVACDLHPEYMSTRYALAQKDIPVVAVQHHFAHIVSCMAENHLDGEVIGIALDGTGYGADGNIWGGEILRASLKDYRRVAHLEYLPMPGGEKAIQFPWRMAVSCLYHAFSEDMLKLDLEMFHQIPLEQITPVLHLVRHKIGIHWTSSAGRLFDAVAALLCLKQEIHYEGQAAIMLEMEAAGLEAPQLKEMVESGKLYRIEIQDNSGTKIKAQDNSGTKIKISVDSATKHVNSSVSEPSNMQELWVLSPVPMIRQIVSDLQSNVAKPIIAYKYHLSLAYAFVMTCHKIREQCGLNRVALSGGVFQNRILLEQISFLLKSEGFDVFTHHYIPTNDGCISLGQAVAAAHRLTI